MRRLRTFLRRLFARPQVPRLDRDHELASARLLRIQRRLRVFDAEYDAWRRSGEK